MNCSLHLIHKNDFGYTALCKECGNVHFEIGHFLTVVSQDSFSLITKEIIKKNNRSEQFLFDTPNGEKHFIQISKTAYITLNKFELEQVIELVEVSQLLLESYQLIKF